MIWDGRPRKKLWEPLALLQNTPVNKKITHVLVDRVGIRVGYYNEPHDIPEQELYDRARDLLDSKIYQAWGVKNRLSGTEIYEIFGDIKKKCRYQARGFWLQDQNKEIANPNLRTLWYVWIRHADPEARKWLKVHHIKRHMMGVCFPASGDYEDYMPGGLSPQINQGFYACNWYHEKAILRNYDDYYSGPVLIHPVFVLDYKLEGEQE